MKIAFVGTRGVPAKYGGFETAVDEIASRLVRKGHEVYVYCRSTDTIPLSEYNGIKLINISSIKNKVLETPIHTLMCTIDILNRNSFDIIQYFNQTNAVFTLLPRIIQNRKVFLWVDGLEWKRAKWNALIKRLLLFSEFLAVKCPNYLSVDSKTIQKYYREKYLINPLLFTYGSNFPQLTNSVLSSNYPFKSKKYILFVGRLVPEKGIHTLIKAFKRIKTEFHLVIIGDDVTNSQYKQSLIKLSNKNNRIHFLGYVYGEEFYNLLRNSYLYVSASELEGTSPALLTAMGFGKCVLVSDIIENLEVIGSAGLTFTSGSDIDLKKKLEELLFDNTRIVEYEERARLRVNKKYNWDRITDTIEKEYLDAIKKGKK